MAGGHATHRGIQFQDEVSAVMATHVLAGLAFAPFDLPASAIPTRIQLEATSPVDDLVATTADGGFCFVNVKRNVQISSKADSPLGSVVEQFVRQYLAMRAPTGTRSWERAPDLSRDRFVLVTAGANVARLLEGAEAVLGRISRLSEMPSREEAALSSVQKRVFDSLLALIGTHWKKHTGEDAAPGDVLSVLKLMRVVRIDPDTGVVANAIRLLRDVVVDRPAEAEAAWEGLKLLCHELASRRASVDQLALRNVLIEKRIDLRTVSHLTRDIQRLQEFSQETLASLEHLATLVTPENASPKGEAIERTATAAIVREAGLGSFLVVGEPGAGKSGALYAAAKQLQNAGIRTLVIAVDQHRASTMSELFRDIGIENPLVEILSGWAGHKPGVLIIDALDAARGGTSEAVFQRLVRDVLTKLPSWHVVASIREFDLRFGVVYRDLFAGRVVDQELRHPDFAATRHLRVSRLTDTELSQLWARSPSLSLVFRRASSPLQSLLRSPFNLFLLSSILRARIEASVQDVSTQVELLDKYWSYRVIDQDGQSARREAVLASVVDAMVVSRSLALESSLSERYASDEWRDLFSRGVLSALRARAEQIILFGFSHHMLFDYAVARLLLKSGQTADFSKILTQSDDLALLLSPGAILALRMLWEENEDRRSFWQRSIELARADAAGSFCRMLPARIAADSTESATDWDSLFGSLTSVNDSEREAARFLIRHAIGALTIKSFPRGLLFGASARPWTSILRRLVEVDVERLRWTIRPFLHEAVASNELLTAELSADVGVMSRLLLDTSVNDPNDTSGVALAIRGIAHTFSTDSSASARSLQSVLTPSRVAIYGYTDLFWLAGEVATLLSKGDAASQTISDVYRAAFCSPLPPRDKETNLGGRILSLRSNQRQDFEGARHRLVQDYADFVACHPVAATGVLLAAMEYYEKEERTSRGGGAASSFRFRGYAATYQQDGSAYWQNFNKSDAVALLEQYKRSLSSLVKKQPSGAAAIVDYVASNNRLAGMWAALLSVGAECPDSLGILLVELLSTQVVLEGADSTKQAGDLVTALFSSLDVETRKAIEAAVMKCNKHVQRVLLGCMPAASLASEAAIERRAEFERANRLLPNDDPYRVESGWTERGDRDWWLRSEGVDVDAEPNRTVNEKFRALEEATRAVRNNSDSATHSRLWQDALSLAEALESTGVQGEALLMGARSAIADTADLVALHAKTSNDLAGYPRILDLVTECLRDSNWPPPIANPEREREFAKGPSWSSPSPRVGGAQAIMAIARALGATTPEMDALIRRLASDPRPEVRFQILSRANMIFNANRDLMFEILDAGFSTEQNEGVVSGLLSAAARALRNRPSWFSDRLFKLRERFPSKDEERDRIEPVWTQSIVTLAVDYGDAEAERAFWSWAQDPSRFEEHVRIVFSFFRSAVTLGDVDGGSDRESKVRKSSIRFFFESTRAATELANELMAVSDLTDESRERLTAAVKVLDSAATEIYFGSGAYQDERAQESDPESDGPVTAAVAARFLKEFGPTLETLAQAPYPSITHHLLQTLEAFIDVDPEFVFRVAMRALNDGGRRSGYRFESMGISLFDRIVRRYLADHRTLIAKSAELRKELMAALDTFVETGWAEARELVYQLPEMLR